MKVLLSQRIHGIAGSETYLLQLAIALTQKGIHVGVLILHQVGVLSGATDFLALLQKNHITDVYLMEVGRWPRWRDMRRIAKHIRAGEYELVHSNLLHADMFMALVKVLFYRSMKLVSGKHGYEESYNARYGFDPFYKTINAYWISAFLAERLINRSFAISKGLYGLYTGLGICAVDRLDHIPYGFDYHDPGPPPPEYRFGNPQLCMVGRLTAFKGHRFALEALSQLSKTYPDIRLVMVGWGDAESNLREQCRRLSIEKHAIFAGRQNNPRAYMAASDIVLVPSVAEGFGIVILEAMSAKRPIVAFDVPSPNEILGNGCGLLVPPFDVEAYAMSIKYLLEQPTAASAIADRGYAKLKEYFNQDRMVSETILFYNKVLSS